jgi:hypothetical protein
MRPRQNRQKDSKTVFRMDLQCGITGSISTILLEQKVVPDPFSSHTYMYSNTYTCISITCTYSDNAVCVISSSLVVAGTGRGCLCASGAA